MWSQICKYLSIDSASVIPHSIDSLADGHGAAVVAVAHVEVGRIVVVAEHRYDDSEESANLWYNLFRFIVLFRGKVTNYFANLVRLSH